MLETKPRGWKEGYAEGQARVAKRAADRHMKRALRKYKTGELHTVCMSPDLPALVDAGWEIEQAYNVSVSSRRYLLRHARP